MEAKHDVFIVPVLDKFLIHAPLHDFTVLVNRQAARQIRSGLIGDGAAISSTIQPIVERLSQPRMMRPRARDGRLSNPFFLGLIPTRGCNMGCPYCDFSAPKTTSETMDLNLAREAVDAYVKILVENGHRDAEVHFFGGEPFYAEEVIHFVVNYATMRADELDLNVRFEATSNGLYNTARAHWIADYFDSVVLSLDGTEDVQNRNRPGLNGRSVFDAVTRTARIFSERSIDLVLRSCITKDTVARMPEFAEWIVRDFRPSIWCVETLTDSPLNEAAGLELPDPWEFARNFHIARDMLAPYGIEIVNSTTDIRTRQLTFCPVGRDAMIISPDGSIDACYLLKKDWSRNGLNMRYGHLHVPEVTEPVRAAAHQGFIPLGEIGLAQADPNEAVLHIDDAALQGVRSLNVDNRPLCADCMCRFHCAGGCHVNHNTSAEPGDFDGLCIHTRLITIASLLKDMGQANIAKEWFSDRAAMETSIWQKTDRIADRELVL